MRLADLIVLPEPVIRLPYVGRIRYSAPSAAGRDLTVT